MRGRHLKIRGDKWKIVIGRPPENKCDGLCHYATSTIYIRPSADRIPTIVHEILHACLWDVSEEAIEETEDALVKALELLA